MAGPNLLMQLLAGVARAQNNPQLPGPANNLPSPVKALLAAIPSPVQPLVSPVGQATARAINPLALALMRRIADERNTINEDVIPNPAAGHVGPAELHYNPLRDMPLLGGAINHAVNVPLHSAGLINEGAGNVAQVGAGGGAALLGLLSRGLNSPAGPAITAASQASPVVSPIVNALLLASKFPGGLSPTRTLEGASRAYQEQGGNPVLRALAANAAAKEADPVRGTLSEMTANPLNFTGPVGEVGAAMTAPRVGIDALGGVLRNPNATQQAIGGLLKGVGAAGEVANRLPLLPLALLPRARAALLEAPAFMRGAGAASDELAAVVGGIDRSRPPLPPRATLPDLGAPPPPVQRIPLAGVGASAPPTPLPLPRPITPATPAPAQRPPLLPFPTREPKIAARAADYMAGRGLPPAPAPATTGGASALLDAAGAGRPAPASALPTSLLDLPRSTQAAQARLPLNPLQAMLQPRTAAQTPLERIPDLEGLAGQAQGTGGLTSTLPDPSNIIEAAYHTGDQAATTATAATPDVGDLGAVGDETDWAAELLAGIEDAVRRGAVEEANALVESAPDFGVPVSRAQQVLNAAADAGGADVGAQAQRAMIEESPYFQVFKHFNRDGTVKKVNPTNGAKLVLRDNGRIVKGADEVWNLPGSGYDEVAASALDNAAVGHNQNYGQSNDEFWRNAQAAYLEYQRLKQPGATMGGDLAAGGGGFGITPGGMGLLPEAATRAMIGGGAGGVVGGVAGGATGLVQGDRGEDLLGDVGKGAAIGVGVGTGAGLVPPSAYLPIARDIARGMGSRFDNTMSDPAMWGSAIRYGWRNLVKRGFGSTANTAGERVGAFWAQQRAQVVNTFKQLPQDALTQRATIEGIARREFPGIDDQAIRSTQGLLRVEREAETPAAASALPFLQKLRALGRGDLVADDQAIADLLGTDFATSEAQQSKQLGPLGRGIAGGAIGTMNAARELNPLAPVVGVARGIAAPFVDGVVQFLNGIQHDSLRFVLADAALDRDLPKLAGTYLSVLADRGADITPLVGKTYITPADVAAVAGRDAGAEWSGMVEQLVRDQGDRIAGLAGDFRDKLRPGYAGKVTTGDKVLGVAEKGVSKLAPYSRWSIRYAPVYAEMLARNPRVASLLGGYVAANHEQGRDLGTVPISTETPVLGGLYARPRLGFQKGTARLGLLDAAFPYSEAVTGGTDLADDATGYQKVVAAAGRLGLGPNPLIQAGAYVTGQDFRAPGSLSRTAGLESAVEAVPPLARAVLHATGRHELANRVPDLPMLPGGRQLLDAGRNLLKPVTGEGAVTSADPVARRYAELVLTATHKPLQDPSNRGYLESMGDQDNGLWQLAVVQARVAGGVGNVTSMTAPIPVRAQSVEAANAQAAPKLPYTPYQISQAPKARQAAMQAANDKAAALNPASATYTNISGYGRKATLLAQWDRDHQFLKKSAPALWAQQRGAYEASLGSR